MADNVQMEMKLDLFVVIVMGSMHRVLTIK